MPLGIYHQSLKWSPMLPLPPLATDESLKCIFSKQIKDADPTTGPLNSGPPAASPVSLAGKARNSENLQFTNQTSFNCVLIHPAYSIKAKWEQQKKGDKLV